MSSTVPDEPQEELVEAEMQYIMVRRQQLEHRRSVLLEMQGFLKNNKITEGGLDEEEEEEHSELERIEKELRSLSETEKKLISVKSLLETQPTTGETTEETVVALPEFDFGILDKKKDRVMSGVCILPSFTEKNLYIVELPSEQEPSPTESHPENSEVVDVQNLSRGPGKVICPSCQEFVTTEIQYTISSTSFILCFLMVIVGCFIGCCLLPFFLKSLKDIYHACPSCHSKISTVKRI